MPFCLELQISRNLEIDFEALTRDCQSRTSLTGVLRPFSNFDCHRCFRKPVAKPMNGFLRRIWRFPNPVIRTPKSSGRPLTIINEKCYGSYEERHHTGGQCSPLYHSQVSSNPPFFGLPNACDRRKIFGFRLGTQKVIEGTPLLDFLFGGLDSARDLRFVILASYPETLL